MLTSKFTVAYYLQQAAAHLGTLHRLAAEASQVVMLNNVRVAITWPKNTRSPGTYLALNEAAEKFAGLKLTERQPVVGLNVDGLEIKVTDVGLVNVAARRAMVPPPGFFSWPAHFIDPTRQRSEGIEVKSSSWTGREAPPYNPPEHSPVSVGGQVNKALGHCRLVVEGPVEVVTKELGQKLRETVSAHEDSLREAARLEAKRLAEEKAKPSIQKRALSSLSTWEFSQKHREQLAHYGTKIVGQHYRDAKSQDVISKKRVGNMVLLVRQPDNEVDSNAVMVLAWDHGTKAWFHVGYVPADQASLLRSRWTVNPFDVAVGVITAMPHNWDGHRAGPSIEIELTGEVRVYPNFRG